MVIGWFGYGNAESNWEVPSDGTYVITVSGAQEEALEKRCTTRGTFEFTEGETIGLVVGKVREEIGVGGGGGSLFGLTPVQVC